MTLTKFPSIIWEYTQPHDYSLQQYKVRYDQLAHLLLDVWQWRVDTHTQLQTKLDMQLPVPKHDVCCIHCLEKGQRMAWKEIVEALAE
jgi:hypothetical protein